MTKVFKMTVIFASILAAGIFALQFLISLMTIFLSLAQRFAPQGDLVDGNGNGFLLVRAVLQLTVIGFLMFIAVLLTKFAGSAFLAQATFRGTVRTVAKAPFKSIGRTARGGLNFLRGLRHLNQNDLRKYASRRALFGNRTARKIINRKDDLDMIKSISERGADGKLRKKNLKELKKQGLTPEDTRKSAGKILNDKERAKIANLGVDKKMWDKLGRDDKDRIADLVKRDDMSLDEKRDAAKQMRKENLLKLRESAGLGDNVSDEALEKMVDRKHNAALAHGQQLDGHINKAMETMEKNGIKVYDNEGNATSFKDYIDSQDDKALRTSDKFREAHKETLGSYAAKGVMGTTLAMYALDISRTNEENRNSTVNGSINPAYTQPVASTEERQTDQAARVHGRIPIDEDVAKKHAEKANKDMEEITSSDVGFRSTDDAPIKEDKTPRDEKGNAVSTFNAQHDEYVQAAEIINSGSPYGSMLPATLTEDFDPAKMTEESIIAESEKNLATYASGTFRPDVMAEEISDSEIDNAFRMEPLTAERMYGYAGNVDTTTIPQEMSMEEQPGSSSAIVDTTTIPQEMSMEEQPGSSSAIVDRVQDTGNNQNAMKDELDSVFLGGQKRENSERASQGFSSAWNNGNSNDMTRYINDMTRDIGNSHNVSLNIPDDVHDRMKSMLDAYQKDVSNGVVKSADEMEARIRDISSVAAGSIAAESISAANRNKSSSAESEEKMLNAKNSVDDAIHDMLEDVSRTTMNRKAEAEEEERRQRGTDGIRDSGNRGRRSR